MEAAYAFIGKRDIFRLKILCRPNPFFGMDCHIFCIKVNRQISLKYISLTMPPGMQPRLSWDMRGGVQHLAGAIFRVRHRVRVMIDLDVWLCRPRVGNDRALASEGFRGEPCKK